MKKRVCVILHLYYIDLWQYFLPYLQNIDGDVDLYVSFTNDNLAGIEEAKESINKYFKNNNVYILPNRGMDIASFVFIMNDINNLNKKYDCIVKLHGKKSLIHSEELGNRWRNDLTNAIIGSKDIFNSNYNEILTSENNKVVASTNWIIGQAIMGFEQKFFTETIPDAFTYYFVGGTMFMADFNLINDWFVNESIFDRFYGEFPMGYIEDLSIAHNLERILGLLVYLKGYRMLGV
jgi:lipopolysaccharide biosynthesis protein